MADIKLVNTGSKSLNRLLNALGSDRARRLNQTAMRAAMRIVLNEARATIPVVSGRLRSNISVRAMRRSTKRIGMLVEQKAGAFKGEAYYGSFVELGWKTGSRSGRALRKGAGGVYKLRANPTERRKVEGKWYMRNASINKEQEARDVYYDGLSKLIDAEARRSGND